MLVLSGTVTVLAAWWLTHWRPTALELPGMVEIQEVRLGSKVGGRVERVAVHEGDLVQAEQPLVYFEAPELKAQLRQSEARLQSARARQP